MKRGLSIILLGLILAAGIGVRAVHLDADAPLVFPNGMSSSAPIKDEAAKCYAARNRARFGSWSTSEADDYRFWEILSPVWTWSLYLWFKAVGPGYAEGRVFSVIWSAVSILAVYFILLRRGRVAGLIGAAFFALNFYAVIYGRLALLETLLNALLLLAFAFQVKSEERPLLMAPAGLLWLGAWLVKQSAIAYLPVLVIGGIILFARNKDEGARAWIALLAVVIVVAIAGFFFLDPDYRLRSIMNVRHALDYKPDPSYLWMRVDPARTWLAVRENFTTGLFRGYLLMMPLAGPLAIVELMIIGLGLLRRERLDSLALLAALWWVFARMVLSIQGHSSPRFYLVQVPPTLMLAAMALSRLPLRYVHSQFRLHLEGVRESGRAYYIARALVVLVVAASAAIHFTPWLKWRGQYPREIGRAAGELHQMLQDTPAVVAGEWAGPLCFDSPYRYFYLKSVFNRTADHVRALGITHLLIEEGKQDGLDIDPAARRMQKYFPSIYEHRQEIGRTVLWKGASEERVIVLYAVSFSELP